MPVYKDEKRNTWYVRFRYTDWKGTKKETTKRGFGTKREAKKYEESVKKEKTIADGMTFGTLYAEYEADITHRLKPTTLATKKKIADIHILPYFKDTAIATITPAIVRKWQTEIIGKGLSQTTIKTIQQQLSAVFNFAVKFYNLSRNPVQLAGSVGKSHAGEMAYWTKKEFWAMMQYEHNPMYRAIFLTLFWCGLRRGELLALTGNDIDMNTGIISITKTYTRIERKDYIMPPKTHGSIRKIKAPSVVIDAIREYIARQYGFNSHDRIFTISSNNIGTHLHKMAKIAGVKDIRVHDLRHSHASYLINNNVPIKIISARLGHDNVETTLRVYAHMYKDATVATDDMIEKDSNSLWSK